jgi:hypothetical protein
VGGLAFGRSQNAIEFTRYVIRQRRRMVRLADSPELVPRNLARIP